MLITRIRPKGHHLWIRFKGCVHALFWKGTVTHNFGPNAPATRAAPVSDGWRKL